MKAVSRIEMLLEFSVQNPDDPFTKYLLALEYIKAGNDDEALLWMQNVNQNHPDYIPNYYHYGKLLERLGMMNQAEQTYTQGMTVAQKNNDQHTYMELKGAYEILTNS